jgi:hypothetical protein
VGPVGYRLRAFLRARWTTALGLAAVVAVVGGGVLTLVAGAARTITAPDRYSASLGDQFDVTLEQSGGPPRTAEIASLPAVEDVQSATFVFGAVAPPGTDDFADALVFAGSPAAVTSQLVEGREPDPDEPGEFAATRTFLDFTGATLGDRFDLVTLTQATADARGFDAPEPDGPSLTATLVGVLGGPSELEDGYAVALFPDSLLDIGDVGVAATVGVAGLAPGARMEDLRRELDGLPDGDVFSFEPADWLSSDIRAAVNAQGQGLVVLAMIVAAAAFVVLGQLLGRQLRLGDGERSTLMSLGLGRVQLVGDPLSRGAVAVLAGCVAAGVLAYFLSGIFPTGFVRIVEPHPGRRVDWLVHAGGATVLALGLVLWMTIAFAMGGRERAGARSSPVIERAVTVLPSARMATAFRFAFSPHRSGARAARSSIVGLGLVICALVGALTFGANLIALVDEPDRYGFNFDLGLGAGGDEIPEQVVESLTEVPEVAALTLYGTIRVSVGAQSLYVTGMRSVAGDLAPDVLNGALPRHDDEVALGRVSARALDAGVGDVVEVSGAGGPRRLHVTGLALIPSVAGGDGIGEGAIVTERGLTRLDPAAALSEAAIRLSPDAPRDAAAQISATTQMAAGPFDPPSAIVNLRRIRGIPLFVASVLAALAALSLGHLMITAVRRRRHDFAVLGALGASRRWVSGVVQWQATFTTLLVLAIAIPAGIVVGITIFRPFVDRIGAARDIAVPVAWLGATFLVLLLLANLATAVPARRARRVSAAELLVEE